MKGLVLIILLFNVTSSFAQSDCVTIDEQTGLAYNKNDSNLFTGICDKYYKNGNTKYICNYENGKIITSRGWNKKGILMDSSIYLDGYNEYIDYRFYPNGSLKSFGKYSDDRTKKIIRCKALGIHTEFWKNGNKKSEVDYFDGNDTIQITYYFENGSIKSDGIYYSNSPDALMTAWHPDSTITNYYINGSVESILLYTNGKKNGISIYYYENEKPKEERTYENDILINPVKFWDSEGIQFEIVYRIGPRGEPSGIIRKRQIIK